MAILIPVFVGLLYIHGEAFRGAYLGYWGLPSELFELGFEESVAQGGVTYLVMCQIKSELLQSRFDQITAEI